MARRTRARAARRVGLLGAFAGLLIGCAGGTHKAAGLPDPAPGEVAAFDLNTLSSRYDLNHMVSDIPSLSHVASDQAGNAYLMDSGPRFAYPDPIGERPGGSLVVLDVGRVWSVKNGHTTTLAGKPSASGVTGTVDGSGTTYALMDGKTIGDLLAIPPGKPPHALNVIGHVPGGSTSISALRLLTIDTVPTPALALNTSPKSPRR